MGLGRRQLAGPKWMRADRALARVGRAKKTTRRKTTTKKLLKLLTSTKTRTRTRTRTTTSRSKTKTKTSTRTKTRTSTSRTRTKTTTKKLAAKATQLRKSFPLGLKPPVGDAKFKNATKKAVGAALYHKNTAKQVARLLLDVAGKSARMLPGDSGSVASGDWRELIKDTDNRRKALDLLRQRVATATTLNATVAGRKIRRAAAADANLLRYAKGVARVLGAAVTLPQTFDLRTTNMMSTVKDQGNCGSCVAFAAMAALESTMLVKSNGVLGDGTVAQPGSTSPDLSESHAIFCAWPNAACDTGYYLDDAATNIASTGVLFESCQTYLGHPLSPDPCKTACSLAPTGNFSRVALGNDVQAIKEHVYTYGAVMTSMAIYQDFLDWSNGAACANTIWRGASRTVDPIGGHAVAIVGWEEDGTGAGAWIAKNSWGDGWCDGGYFRIGYGVDAFAGSGDTQGFTWLPATTDCPAQGLVRCGNGVCAQSAAGCTVPPETTCADGQYLCSDGTTCTTNASQCPSSCPAGQVECWNGECRADFETCINDFPPESTDCSEIGQWTCLDGTCSPDPETCSATCESMGLETCSDGVTCVTDDSQCDSCDAQGLLECPDGMCALTGAECLDTCALEGKVMCPNLECEDNLQECSAECGPGMVKCPLDGSCQADASQCPTCESLGRVTCPNDDGDLVCAQDAGLCPGTDGDCESAGLVECDAEIGDSHVCALSEAECPALACTGEKPITCDDGSCAESEEDCDGWDDDGFDATCETYDWVTCSDGDCAPTQLDCDGSLTCDAFDMDTCSDGTCAWDSEDCEGSDDPEEEDD